MYNKIHSRFTFFQSICCFIPFAIEMWVQHRFIKPWRRLKLTTNSCWQKRDRSWQLNDRRRNSNEKRLTVETKSFPQTTKAQEVVHRHETHIESSAMIKWIRMATDIANESSEECHEVEVLKWRQKSKWNRSFFQRIAEVKRNSEIKS